MNLFILQTANVDHKSQIYEIIKKGIPRILWALMAQRIFLNVADSNMEVMEIWRREILILTK